MSSNKRVAHATLIALAIVAYTESAAAVDVLVPAYFYPYQTGSDWSRLDDALEQVGITAIMNPASGPGASVDSNYTAVTTSFKNAGGTLIGYITSSYFRQSTAPYAPLSVAQMDAKLELMKDQADLYINWYGVEGFFVDEVYTPFQGEGVNEDILEHYQDFFDYVNTEYPNNAYVIGNPGINSIEEHISDYSFDVMIQHEFYDAAVPGNPNFQSPLPVESWTPPAWVEDYDEDQFAAIPYNVSSARWQDVVDSILEDKHASNLYVTDEMFITIGGTQYLNPWTALPTYWDDFVDYVEEYDSFGGQGVPEPSGLALLGIGGMLAAARIRFRGI